jgi:hypothetical protein
MVIENGLLETGAIKAVEEHLDELGCKHHWVIEAANGPVSWGECQICHEGREFQNSITDGDRDY